MQRMPYHHGDLRAALIEAATSLVSAHGSEGFSLRQAAALVGVAPSACYKHFADRSELLAEVARVGFSRLAGAMENALRGSSGSTAALEAIALAYVEFALQDPARFQVMFGPHGAGSSRPDTGTGPNGKTSYQIFRQVLDDLQTDGIFRPGAREQAELPLWAAMHGLAGILISRAMPEPDQVAVGPAVLQVVRCTLSGLLRGR